MVPLPDQLFYLGLRSCSVIAGAGKSRVTYLARQRRKACPFRRRPALLAVVVEEVRRDERPSACVVDENEACRMLYCPGVAYVRDRCPGVDALLDVYLIEEGCRLLLGDELHVVTFVSD